MLDFGAQHDAAMFPAAVPSASYLNESGGLRKDEVSLSSK